MPSLSVLLKPVSGRCNLRCRYCFYADEACNRETPDYGIMSEETAGQIIKKSLAFADGSCTFGFQGGEPTLRGLDFYRRFTELVKRYNTKNVPASYQLQTNGMLLDAEWAEFFRQEHFLIGLSLDGDKALHDESRVDALGNGTFLRVQKAAQILGAASVAYNVLTVVTRQTARNIQHIYSFFKKNGFTNQQYIPCLDPLFSPAGAQAYSLRPEDYEAFLFRLFDQWLYDRMEGREIYIRYFENLAGMLLGKPPESCSMRGQCGRQLVVEADGSAYPCDFYMLDDYRVGNFNKDEIADMFGHPNELRFLQESCIVPDECKRCSVGALCRNGCRRDRQGPELRTVGRTAFCSAYRAFLPYAIPQILALLRKNGHAA